MRKMRKLWGTVVVLMVAGLLLMPIGPVADGVIPTPNGYAWSG